MLQRSFCCRLIASLKHVSPSKDYLWIVLLWTQTHHWTSFFGLMDFFSSLRLKSELCKFVTTSLGVSTIDNNLFLVLTNYNHLIVFPCCQLNMLKLQNVNNIYKMLYLKILCFKESYVIMDSTFNAKSKQHLNALLD